MFVDYCYVLILFINETVKENVNVNFYRFNLIYDKSRFYLKF